MTITELPRPRVARMYLKASQKAEQRGAHHRRRLLDRLTGTVIELGGSCSPRPAWSRRSRTSSARLGALSGRCGRAAWASASRYQRTDDRDA